MNKKVISVIVPVYNQEKWIGRCLRSLLNQTIPSSDYEIIVVNDGSTDLTDYALHLFSDPFDSVVKILNNEKNKGLPSSINKAIEASSGLYIVRVDSDDFVNVNFLSFLHYYLEANDYADAVACDYLLLDDNEKELKRCNCENEPIACGIMFKKEHLINIGLYDESFLCHEERELRLRYEKKYKISRLDIPLYRYRRHENNLTNNKELMTYHEKKLNQKLK